MSQITDSREYHHSSHKQPYQNNTNHKTPYKDLHNKILSTEIYYNTNYKPYKLLNEKELITHIRDNLPLTKKTIQQFNEQMESIEKIFHDQLYQGFQIDTYVNRFFTVIEKRIKNFINSISDIIYKNPESSEIQIPNDYRCNQMRNLIRQELLNISNKIYDKFASIETPSEYDRKVLKNCEQILRLYDLLKYDNIFAYLISKSQLQLNQILEQIFSNQNFKCISISDILEKLIFIDIKRISEDVKSLVERNPLQFSNKAQSLLKFHNILKEQLEDDTKIQDIVNILKSLIVKDRNEINQQVFTQLNKDIDLTAPQLFNKKIDGNNEFYSKKDVLYSKLLKLRRDWENLCREKNYQIIYQGQLNESNFMISQKHFQYEYDRLYRINEFQIKVSFLKQESAELLKEINEFKVFIKLKTKESLDKAISLTIKNLSQSKDNVGIFKDSIEKLIKTLFSDLNQILNKNPEDFISKDSQIENSIQLQLEKKKDNPYLKQIQEELQKKGDVRKQIQQNQKKQNDLLQAQVDSQIQNRHQRTLQNEDQSTRPYSNGDRSSPKIVSGSSVNHQQQLRQEKQKLYDEHRFNKIYDSSSSKQSSQSSPKSGYLVDQFLGQQDVKPKTNYNDASKEIKKPEPLKKPEPVKPEPPKVEDKKYETPKDEVKKPEPQKVEVKKPETPKEIKKPEPPKVEVKKPEPPKVEVKKPEPPKEIKKPEPSKVVDKKPEAPKVEVKKPEPPKEIKKPEPPRVEVKKPEPPKVEVKKPEPPKEIKKPEPPKVELKKPEPPVKVEQPKPEPPKEVKKPEPIKVEQPKPVEVKKPEPIKVEQPKPVEIKKPEPPAKIEQPKPEPPKELKKPEPIKVEQPKPVEVKKPEPIKVEQPKPVEVKKPEPVKVEQPKPEPPKVEQPKPVEVKKPEPPKVEQPKPVEVKKPEPIKVEQPKPEPPKVEQPKPEPPKVEQPKPEPPKVEPKKPEPVKIEQQKPELPKIEQPKPIEVKKPEPVKVEQPKPVEVKKPEPPKVEPKKEEPKRPEPQKVKPLSPQFDSDIDEFIDEAIESIEDESMKKPSKPNQQMVKPQTQPFKQPQTQPFNEPNEFSDFDEDLDLPLSGGKPQLQAQVQQKPQSMPQEDVEENEIEQHQINTPENLKIVNDYIFKTKYGQQAQISLEEYNDFDHVVQLFEEGIQQGTSYFLDYSDAQMLLEITEKALQGEDPQEDMQLMLQSVIQRFQQLTQEEGFSPETRIFLPLLSEMNSFGIIMFEKNPEKQTVIIYHDKPIPQEILANNEEFETMVSIFQNLFDCPEEWDISQVVLEPQGNQIIASLGEEAIHLQYMLLLFCVIYEAQEGVVLSITMDTLKRLFWTLDCCEPFYMKLEQELDSLQEKFDGMIVNMNKDKAIASDHLQFDLGQGWDAKVSQEIIQAKANFVKERSLKQKFILIELIHETGTFVYYVHLSKISTFKQFKVFFLDHQQQLNDQFMQLVIDPDDLTFKNKVYIDYTRHNGLYQYAQFSLPIWMHLTTKKGYSAEDAFAILNFNLVPFYVNGCNLD